MKTQKEEKNNEARMLVTGENNLKRSPVLMYEQQVKRMKLSFKELKEKVQRLPALSKWAIVKHDKDKNEQGETVLPHYHVVLIFKRRVSLEMIAKKLKDRPQQFEIMTKRGKSAKSSANNALAYLVHRTTNSRDKYQYDVNAVVANFDYVAFIKRQEAQMKPQDILDLLGEGKITKQDSLTQMMDLGATTLSFYKKKIEDVHAARIEIEYQQWLKEMKEKKQKIKIIWCYGPGGTGKTRFAKEFCKRHDLNYFICSGSNSPFDGLNDLSATQQEVLIIDELRPGVIRYQDLLQLIDPMNYEKFAVARYRNPRVMAKVIFICTVYSPLEFYKSMPIINRKVDTVFQLNRRIGLTLRFSYQTIDEVINKRAVGVDKQEYTVIKEHENQYVSEAMYTGFSLKDLELYGEKDNKK